MQERKAPRPDDIARRVLLGEERALARLISAMEDGESWAGTALRLLRKEVVKRNSDLPAAQGRSLNSAERGSAGELGSPAPRVAHVIGITGPPGSGKSTLIDKLIGSYRERGERVGVLAIDPSSPFTGGAILGDRIRMQGSALRDEGVFIRSLATRGRLGGLSRASALAVRALEAALYGIVIVETVGIGQSEVDIIRLADSVVLVSMPGSGDEIQTIKAGVMEIGDLFVVNKADRPGAEKAVREIRSMLEMGDRDMPSVLMTVAETGEGVGELVAALDSRWAKLKASGELEARRRRGAIAEARALLSERVRCELEALEGGLEDSLADEIVRGEREATEAAEILFESIRKGDRK
jgi:LAO/AO transport system kinase